LWLGVIAAGGFSLWFIVLNMPGIKVSEISIWKFILPVLGAILAWIILPDEHPEWVVILGVILVALSLFVMYYKKDAK
jgi:drug/metabolite transporter (DMT)-like permease